MKDTSKTMTLAGTIYQTQFNRSMLNETILEYTNVLDIGRAWKVKSFDCWIASDVDSMVFVQNCLIDFRFSLATDEVGNAADYWKAGDNRLIGFKEVAYACAEDYYKPIAAYSGAPTQNLNVETYMKPNHIIQNRLDIAFSGTGSHSIHESAYFDFNYIIELEEVTVTPTESIVFNIKSAAQDLEN